MHRIFLLSALLLALLGCGSSKPVAQLPPVAEQVWRQVDTDIVAASKQAAGQANQYARANMERWMDLVYQRTEAEFIPWYTGYWTQQWLTMKVAWYQLGSDSTSTRLATYLQEEYQEQVLDPVGKDIDPSRVMAQTAALYVQGLSAQLPIIAERYGVPPSQFDQHLQSIAAIALAPPAEHNASLYQLMQAKSLEKLPAYAALLTRINQAGAGSGKSAAGVSSVAQRASEKLEAQVVTRSASSTAAAAVGKVAGLVLSVGVAGFGMLMHEAERPEMTLQVRQTLNAAFDEEWLNLMRNRESGVQAGVYYLSTQVEASLTKRLARDWPSVPLAPGIAAPIALPLQYRRNEPPPRRNYWEAYP